eukprot:486323-Amphidinium_carterae.1
MARQSQKARLAFLECKILRQQNVGQMRNIKPHTFVFQFHAGPQDAAEYLDDGEDQRTDRI